MLIINMFDLGFLVFEVVMALVIDGWGDGFSVVSLGRHDWYVFFSVERLISMSEWERHSRIPGSARGIYSQFVVCHEVSV